MPVEDDPISGRRTTGHEWDGIKELDTPVPWPARWALGLTILFAIAYWLLYPAWPFVSDFTRGALGYSSRAVVLAKLEAAAETRAAADAALLAGDLADLADDPAMRAAYERPAAILARDNCTMCHGHDMAGQTGFPDLTDSHWLWSGDIEEIADTMRYGVNSGHDDERASEMLAFGAQRMLETPQIAAVVEYVLALSGQPHDAEKASMGADVFVDNCAGCHGDDGAGALENGAPSLIDDVWIYGGDREAIGASVWDGRRGVMPAWSGRLSEAEIRKLALYVYWRGRDAND